MNRIVKLACLLLVSFHSYAENYEPVSAAGDFHIVGLENDRVRVLEVTILPGEIVPLHQHTLESVFITLQPASLVFRDVDGNVVRKVEPSDFKKLPHLEFRSSAPAPRTVENTGGVSMRALRVELK